MGQTHLQVALDFVELTRAMQVAEANGRQPAIMSQALHSDATMPNTAFNRNAACHPL